MRAPAPITPTDAQRLQLAGLVFARTAYLYASLRYSLSPIATSLLCRVALESEAAPLARLLAGLAHREEGYKAARLLVRLGYAAKEGRFYSLTDAGRKAAYALASQVMPVPIRAGSI